MASQPPQKISLYSPSDLKSTTDDALAPYLTSLPAPYTFKQSHTYSNVRLGLGYVAVVIAGVLFYVDWKLGWEVTKPYTLPACVTYFTLNGALTWWIWMVERGAIFVGTREGGQRLTLKSSAKKHSPTYTLHYNYSAPSPPAGTGMVFSEGSITGSYTQWFNVHGYLDKKAFQSWLSKNIEVVGMADPASKQAAEKHYDALVDEVVMSGGAAQGDLLDVDTIEVSLAGSGVDSERDAKSPRKRGRPKKKA